MTETQATEGGAAGGGDGAATEQRSVVGELFQSASRAIMVYFVIQMVASGFAPGANKPPAKGQAGGGRGPVTVRSNMFSSGELINMWLYTSNGPQFQAGDPELRLLWQENAIRLGEDLPRKTSIRYPLNTALQNNGTAHLHVFFARAGRPHLSSDPNYVPEDVFGGSYELIKYLPLPKKKAGSNLLSQGGGGYEEEEAAGEVVGHWKPNVTISIVKDFTAYPDPQIPPAIRERMVLDPYSGNYYPPVWFNDFWLLREHLVPLNNTMDEVDLHLEVDHSGTFMWQLLVSAEQQFATQRDFGAMGEHEADMIKRIFIETNPYFLGLTIAVSLLHTVFDLLAFKSDIGFWRNNKSMEGLSARSILIGAGCQVVVFLYLLDNDTSYTVLFSNGLGLGIEFWKVTKAMKVSVGRWCGLPVLKFEDRASYTGNKTKEYDAEAMRYLSYALYPLVGCYSIYSLIYKTHKSWYSWIVNSLVGAVYMFGFILMCPQLYLNYRLKTVAHMPWRQMTYKFLNTIIDDLFAFVIKMPTLHRLSVFRDDLIFVIFLYQRWIYRVDKTRVNEFGFSEVPSPENDGGGCVASVPDGGMEGPATSTISSAIRRRKLGGSNYDGEDDDSHGDRLAAPPPMEGVENDSKKAK